MNKLIFAVSILCLMTLSILMAADMGGNVAAADSHGGEEFLKRLEQYYQRMPASTKQMPDTPAAMRQWYSGYRPIEREMQRLFNAGPKLSEAQALKASIMHARIMAAAAGFSPSKSAAGIVENLSRNIHLFRNCNDDLGIGYCKFNYMDAVRTIETSGKPLSYFFYPEEIASARKLISLIKKYNGVRQSAQLQSAMVWVDPFVVNMSDGKFLKLTLQFELADSSHVPGFNNNIPQLRDAVINLLSTKTANSISSTNGKLSLKEEISQAGNIVCGGPCIKNVYMTDFIIQ